MSALFQVPYSSVQPLVKYKRESYEDSMVELMYEKSENLLSAFLSVYEIKGNESSVQW